jgi:hypothetical protein
MSIRQVQALWRQRISSWEASWVAAWPGMLALALGPQVLDHLALPHQTWLDWVEQPFVEEGKASPSYAIVRDARGRCEVRRNCHEWARAARTSAYHRVIAKKRIVSAKSSPR